MGMKGLLLVFGMILKEHQCRLHSHSFRYEKNSYANYDEISWNQYPTSAMQIRERVQYQSERYEWNASSDVKINQQNNDSFELDSRVIHTGNLHEIKENEWNESENDSKSESGSKEELFLISWNKLIVVVLFSLLIIITVIGNTLVIMSVITTRRLRTVTNCFVTSLAVADWLVGIFVMPPAVMVYVVESWKLGWILCDIWISLDVLLCTASILSLCAISLDRYLAVTQPLTYSKRRRSKRLALFMILIVWLLALAITCPPFLGWYEPGRNTDESEDCRYNQNKGYVVFSAMGSFFIPMLVMLYVYSKICCVLTSRQHRMVKTERSEKSEIETDYLTSECENTTNLSQSPKRNYSVRGYIGQYVDTFERDPSRTTIFELVEISSKTSSTSSTVKNATITCKYSATTITNSNGTNGQSSQKSPTASHGPKVADEVLENGGKSKIKTKTRNKQQILKSIHAVQFSSQSLSDTLITSNSKTRVLHSCHRKHRTPIRISSLKRETKTAQTLSMVMGGFVACWLPFFLYYLLVPFLQKESVSETLQVALTWLGWINSAINPFIYALYNVDFRIAFWRLTFRRFCKNRHSHNITILKS